MGLRNICLHERCFKIRRPCLVMFVAMGIFGLVTVLLSYAEVLSTMRHFALNKPDSSDINVLEPERSAPLTTPYDKSSSVHRCFMTKHCVGRLGNHMFQYASLLGIAKERGCTPVALNCKMLDEYFHVTRTKYTIKFNGTSHTEKYYASFDPSFMTLATNHTWTLVGFLSSWKYFMHIKDIILQEYTFHDEILTEAKGILSQLSTRGVLIGIHVRRGDVLSEAEARKGRLIANMTYLKKAMNYYRNKFTSVTFIVCSDDIRWCNENINASDVRFAHDAERGVHMALLSLCSHSIMTAMSFGWWGSFLAGGEVVYMKDFIRPGSALVHGFSVSDRYPPNWIAL